MKMNKATLAPEGGLVVGHITDETWRAGSPRRRPSGGARVNVAL